MRNFFLLKSPSFENQKIFFLRKGMSEFYNLTSFNTDKLCELKFDHFENIHRLDKKLPVFDGAPNFRQVM